MATISLKKKAHKNINQYQGLLLLSLSVQKTFQKSEYKQSKRSSFWILPLTLCQWRSAGRNSRTTCLIGARLVDGHWSCTTSLLLRVESFGTAALTLLVRKGMKRTAEWESNIVRIVLFCNCHLNLFQITVARYYFCWHQYLLNTSLVTVPEILSDPVIFVSVVHAV